LIGMFTRLIFRKPFHVARAATGPPRELRTQNSELRSQNWKFRPDKRIGHLPNPFRAEPSIGANFRMQQALRVVQSAKLSRPAPVVLTSHF
jgi:hypothetical protein